MIIDKEAAVTLFIKDGLILGISRRHDKTKYGLIGGGVEENETPKQAAIREAKEEADLQLNDCKLIFQRVEESDSQSGYFSIAYCFYAIDWEGIPRSMEEGEVKWLTVEELTSTKAAFADYNSATLKAFKIMYPEIALI